MVLSLSSQALAMELSPHVTYSASASKVWTSCRLSSLVRRRPWTELAPTEYRTASRREPVRTSAGASLTPADHRLT
jgi:hypothetical protein